MQVCRVCAGKGAVRGGAVDAGVVVLSVCHNDIVGVRAGAREHHLLHNM